MCAFISKAKHAKIQCASIAIESMFAMVGFTLLLCAMLEFASWALLTMSVDNACSAASKQLAIDCNSTNKMLKDSALKAAPVLRPELLTVQVSQSPTNNITYKHILPDNMGYTNNHISHVASTICLKYKFTSLTGLGLAYTKLAGNQICSVANLQVDNTFKDVP